MNLSAGTEALKVELPGGTINEDVLDSSGPNESLAKAAPLRCDALGVGFTSKGAQLDDALLLHLARMY